MIQRIQTLYLLVIVLCMSVTLFAPIAWFADAATAQCDLTIFGLHTASGEQVQQTIYLAIMPILATLLPLVTIFLYKRRMLQIRLCAVEFVLLVGSAVMMGVYYWGVCGGVFQSQGMKPAIALPLVSLLFAFLAMRAIFHDELLVRSLNRIR